MNAENTSRKRSLSRGNIVLICLFAVYAVLTFIGAANHEIWYDEAQAWCIARDNDIPGIIAQMQYEGHPPLWHFVLYPFTRLGFSADILPFISWFITLISAGLMLWKAPFRPAMKVIILFSSGFLYYTAIISRVYCLIVLLLVLIAIVYPRRNERPVLYGLLIALLADTHLMMCGLVGILGIYMIIDMVKLWRSSSKLMNIRRVAGLLLAGIGVILLILPILGSLSANDYAEERTQNMSLLTMLNRLLWSFESITLNTTFNVEYIIQQDFATMIYGLIGLMFIIMMFYLRHYKKHFIICLFFTFFYCIICEVIWFSLPSRAVVFLFCYAIIYWMAVSTEKPVFKEPKPFKNPSVNDHPLIRWLRARDKDFPRTYCAVFCIYTALTIPVAFTELFNDYTKDFSYSKTTADFIRENLEPDAVVVYLGNISAVSYSAYLPDHKFYSLTRARFLTYADLQMYDESAKLDCKKIYEDLKDYPNIYMLNYSVFEMDPDEYPDVLISKHGSFAQWIIACDREVNLYRLDLEAFLEEESNKTVS